MRFQCDLCVKTFARKSYLADHKKTHNAIQKKIHCYECRSSFTRQSNLISHFQNAHSEVSLDLTKCQWLDVPNESSRKLKCVPCNRTFARMENLQYHMKVYHTPIVPLTNFCNLCNKTFSTKSNILNHCREFHSVNILFFSIKILILI